MVFFFCWFSCDSLMQNSHFEIYFLAPIVIQRPREVTKGRTFPPLPRPPLPPINNTPSWHDLSWRLHQTCFGHVVGVWGRRESIAFFMLRLYTACNPPFLLKSVEFLSQPARLQTTTLRYNKGLRRRDDKDGDHSPFLRSYRFVVDHSYCCCCCFYYCYCYFYLWQC